jgi:hypothetical protein
MSQCDAISQKGNVRVPYELYDFVDEDGKSVIVAWRTGLSPRSKAAFDSKITMLYTAGMGLPPKLLAGPINKTGHIYKLIIKADIMLRPMLCKGPFDMEREITLLIGAKEIQWKLTPGSDEAVKNRSILLSNKKRRIPHAF